MENTLTKSKFWNNLSPEFKNKLFAQYPPSNVQTRERWNDYSCHIFYNSSRRTSFICLYRVLGGGWLTINHCGMVKIRATHTINNYVKYGYMDIIPPKSEENLNKGFEFFFSKAKFFA